MLFCPGPIMGTPSPLAPLGLSQLHTPTERAQPHDGREPAAGPGQHKRGTRRVHRQARPRPELQDHPAIGTRVHHRLGGGHTKGGCSAAPAAPPLQVITAPARGIENERGLYCLNVGAIQIDDAVAQAALTALAPLGIEAAIAAAARIEADHDGALAQWRIAVELASYEAQRAECRYRAIDSDNRLVARGLEAEWEKSLRELETAKAELTLREQQRPRTPSADERSRLLALGRRVRSERLCQMRSSRTFAKSAWMPCVQLG
jgi:hypothetical protein